MKNTTTITVLSIVIFLLGLFIYTEKTKPDPIDYDSEVAMLESKIDSLNFKSDSLLFKNDSIQKENLHLSFEKDSLKTVIGSKEVKIEKTKKKRDEKIEQVVYGADSTIIRILSNYEYRANLKSSKKR